MVAIGIVVFFAIVVLILGAEQVRARGVQPQPAQVLQQIQLPIDRRLRADWRVQRLLSNRSWAPAAEAAIGYFAKGVECSVPAWQTSSAWLQVQMIYRELLVHPAQSGSRSFQ